MYQENLIFIMLFNSLKILMYNFPKIDISEF